MNMKHDELKRKIDKISLSMTANKMAKKAGLGLKKLAASKKAEAEEED